MNSNPYQILHLEEDASYEEIKERYRHLTRYLHPDKQPLQNYQATKQMFQKIDEAFQAISSPLRRFLFRQYGPTALKILEQMPNEFKQFEEEHLSPEQTKRLRQLMLYLLYERQASIEMDKNKFNTKTLVNISKMMGKKGRSKYQSKRNLFFPQMENTAFEYEMVLPQFSGFSNSFALSQTGSNLRSDPKYSLVLTTSSARRFLASYLLIIQPSISSQGTNLEISIDKICQNNLHLKLTPISMTNFTFNNPKFSIDKSFGNSQVSAITDGVSSSFQFSDYSNKNLGKSLRLYIEPGSLGVVPKIEWVLNNNLRIFVQPTIGLGLSGQENNLNLQTSLAYGYKLILLDDLKLEFTSSIGYPNYFQIGLINSKFRVAVPFATSEGTTGKFQLYKVGVMLLTYLGFQGYWWWQRKSQLMRQKMRRENQGRFAEQGRELHRQASYVEVAAATKKERQIKYKGLVIVKAILGEKEKVEEVKRKIKRIDLQKKVDNLAQSLPQIEEKITNLRLVEQNYKDELCDITILIQNEVTGGQLIAYDLEKMQQYNPCLFDSTRPYLLILYIQRGDLKMKVVECRDKLWLGGKESSEEKVDELLRRGWNFLFPFFRIQ